MIDPAAGPFLFDTSAESWIARSDNHSVQDWLQTYLSLHPIHISAITLLERIRGYSLLWRRVGGATIAHAAVGCMPS